MAFMIGRHTPRNTHKIVCIIFLYDILQTVVLEYDESGDYMVRGKAHFSQRNNDTYKSHIMYERTVVHAAHTEMRQLIQSTANRSDLLWN